MQTLESTFPYILYIAYYPTHMLSKCGRIVLLNLKMFTSVTKTSEGSDTCGEHMAFSRETEKNEKLNLSFGGHC